MTLTRREFFLSGIYVFIVLCVGVYFFFYKFVFVQYQEVDSQIVSVEKALVKIQSIVANEDIVNQRYHTFEKKFMAGDMNQTASTDILQDIKTKAATAGLNVINIKPFTMKEKGGYGEFDFKLETEGKLKNVGRLLYDLDNSPYLFTVKYIQFNARSKAEDLQIQFMLSAILAKE